MKFLQKTSQAYQHKIAFVVLFCVATFLCFYRLDLADLNLRDETPHVYCAINMAEDGQFLSPTFMGQRYWSKPGLACYLKVLSIKLLGNNLYAYRCWSALFALAAIITLYYLGKSVANYQVGFLAGIGMATSFFFLHVHGARHAVPDSMLAFNYILILFLTIRALNTNKGWLLLAVVTAMPSHIKPLAASVPAVLIAITILLSQNKYRPTKKQVIQGLILFAVVNFIWILPMFVVHGVKFLKWHFLKQAVNRRYDTYSFPIDLYLARIALQFLPWGLLGLFGIVEDIRKIIISRDITSIGTVSFFGILLVISSIKLNNVGIWYIYIMLPFLLLSAGRLLFGPDAKPKWANFLTTFACIAVIGITLFFKPNPVESPYTLLTPLLLTAHKGIIQQPQTTLMSLILGLSGALAFGLAYKWNPEKQASHLFWNRCLAWSTLTIAGVAAFTSSAKPLLKEDHQNIIQALTDELVVERAKLKLPAGKKPILILSVRRKKLFWHNMNKIKDQWNVQIIRFSKSGSQEVFSKIVKDNYGRVPVYAAYIFTSQPTVADGLEIIKLFDQEKPYANSTKYYHGIFSKVTRTTYDQAKKYLKDNPPIYLEFWPDHFKPPKKEKPLIFRPKKKKRKKKFEKQFKHPWHFPP